MDRVTKTNHRRQNPQIVKKNQKRRNYNSIIFFLLRRKRKKKKAQRLFLVDQMCVKYVDTRKYKTQKRVCVINR